MTVAQPSSSVSFMAFDQVYAALRKSPLLKGLLKATCSEW